MRNGASVKEEDMLELRKQVLDAWWKKRLKFKKWKASVPPPPTGGRLFTGCSRRVLFTVPVQIGSMAFNVTVKYYDKY